MDEKDNLATFIFLKTLLDEIAESPAKEHAKVLARSLAPLNQNTIQVAFDFIFRPMQIQLFRCAETQTSCDIIEILLDCLHCLLVKSSITKLNRFSQVYISTVNILPQSEKTDNWSEECKYALVCCWSSLFTSSSEDVLIEFYSDENCHKKISPLIYHCLNYATEVTSIKLRSEAVRCVYNALQLDTNKAQRVIHNVFPGILSVCANLLPSVPPAVHHAVATSTVQLWAGAMAVGFSSSDDWVTMAAPRTAPVTKGIIAGGVSHPHHKVRRALASGSCRILKNISFQKFGDNTPALAEGLMELSQDSDRETRETADKGLTFFEEIEHGIRLAESLFKHLECFPTSLRFSEVESRKGIVKKLAGYLKVISVREVVKVSHDLMKRLMVSLLSLATVDPAALPDPHVVPVAPVAGRLEEAGTPSIPLLYADPSALYLLRQAFGRDAVCMAYYFLDEIAHSPSEVALLLNSIVIPELGDCWDTTLINAIFCEYNNRLEALLYVRHINFLEEKRNALLAWLLAEGLGKMATSLGKEKFQPMVVRCLYPLLCAASCRVYIISRAGLAAVDAIGKTMELNGVGAVIAAHVDYLCNSVSYRLKTGVGHSPLDVLLLVLKHSDPSHPSVSEIINRTVIQNVVGGMRCNQLSTSHMLVFKVYLERFVKSFDFQDAPVVKKKELMKRLLELQAAVHVIHQTVHQTDSREDLEEIDLNESKNPYESDEETPEKVAEHVVIADAIVRSCSSFLPSRNPETQWLTLAVIEAGICGSLKESERMLLPAAHYIWPSLVGRFSTDSRCSDLQPLVVSKAFTLLQRLTYATRDFLRARVIKEVFPKLRRILATTAMDSDSTTSPYTFTQKYKLQLNLLQGMGSLCRYIELEGKEVELLLDVTGSYLEKSQPIQLQEACVSMWTSLCVLEPDILWLRLTVLKENPKISPDHMQTLLLAASQTSFV